MLPLRLRAAVEAGTQVVLSPQTICGGPELLPLSRDQHRLDSQSFQCSQLFACFRLWTRDLDAFLAQLLREPTHTVGLAFF